METFELAYKGCINLILLMVCIITVMPILCLLFEHLGSGKDSILLKMLYNITPW